MGWSLSKGPGRTRSQGTVDVRRARKPCVIDGFCFCGFSRGYNMHETTTPHHTTPHPPGRGATPHRIKSHRKQHKNTNGMVRVHVRVRVSGDPGPSVVGQAWAIGAKWQSGVYFPCCCGRSPERGSIKRRQYESGVSEIR
jgi:hypothetical protein